MHIRVHNIVCMLVQIDRQNAGFQPLRFAVPNVSHSSECEYALHITQTVTRLPDPPTEIGLCIFRVRECMHRRSAHNAEQPRQNGARPEPSHRLKPLPLLAGLADDGSSASSSPLLSPSTPFVVPLGLQRCGGETGICVRMHENRHDIQYIIFCVVLHVRWPHAAAFMRSGLDRV